MSASNIGKASYFPINKTFIKYLLDTNDLGFRSKVLSEKLDISQGILSLVENTGHYMKRPE